MAQKNNVGNNTLNLIIDSILLLLLLLMAGVGFLMKYTLLSGEDRMALIGKSTDLEFLGMTRHEWGDIHLIISLIFLALLLLHIILHWTCIECFFRKKIPNRPVRITLAAVTIIFILLTLLGPFIFKARQVPFEPHYRNRFSYSIPQQSVNGYHISGMDIKEKAEAIIR
ncbi:MAG: DUF4405 domain-containing protein [Bacteroidales bacterium]